LIKQSFGTLAPSISAAVTGFLLSTSLIVVIGAQNAHVLRQGLSGNHVGVNVCTCAFFDTVFMFSGVYGINVLTEKVPFLQTLIIWAGFFFLVGYGLFRLYSVIFFSDVLEFNPSNLNLKQSLATVLGVTLLNPQVYLDTVLLVGSVGTKLSYSLKFFFATGAAVASWIWFVFLGYGARFLRPVFNSVVAWRALDTIMGMLMIILAFDLII
tara:strand:- start:765 stop:1397 length:633 start_codon:yes stop_codon:yes gene_type:complete